MKPPAPTRVKDIYFYTIKPPEHVLSPRCVWWVKRIKSGWRPNRRIKSMGCDEAADYYGVYLGEYRYIISPLLKELVDADNEVCA